MGSLVFNLVLLFGFISIAFAQDNRTQACSTPNKEIARCKSIYNCGVLLNVISTTSTQTLKFLRESHCGTYNSTPYVCCGTKSAYTSTGITDPSLSSDEIESRISLRARAGTGDARFNYETALRLGVIPSKDQCGNQEIGNRIYGGEATEIDEFPWMALLEYRKNDQSMGFSCGGALITKRYILTAAHCTTGAILSAVGTLSNIRLGEYNTETEEDCTKSGCALPPINVGVEEILYHPEYEDKSRNRYNDVALIRLARDVEFTDFVKPICLPFNPDNDYVNPGEKLWVAGWGKTEFGTYSPTKLKLRVPLFDQKNCTKVYKRARVTVRSTQLCAGGEANKDSCRGDSGGPLMTLSKDDPARWFVEGVVSFGTECGTPGWPGIYTRISEYTDWILENMRA